MNSIHSERNKVTRRQVQERIRNITRLAHLGEEYVHELKANSIDESRWDSMADVFAKILNNCAAAKEELKSARKPRRARR